MKRMIVFVAVVCALMLTSASVQAQNCEPGWQDQGCTYMTVTDPLTGIMCQFDVCFCTIDIGPPFGHRMVRIYDIHPAGSPACPLTPQIMESLERGTARAAAMPCNQFPSQTIELETPLCWKVSGTGYQICQSDLKCHSNYALTCDNVGNKFLTLTARYVDGDGSCPMGGGCTNITPCQVPIK